MPFNKQAIPDPRELFPMPEHRRVMFAANLDLPPNVEIGDYTYYDDPGGPEAFRRNILYHFDFTGDRLVIGRFCALATGLKFVMNGGNHRVDGFSTYPFPIFGGGWAGHFDSELDFPMKGDTRIGHDVWIGWDAAIMPGVTVGDGAVIASRSVVSRDVPAYAIAAGNPARIVRMRFEDAVIRRLLAIQWWHWDAAKITRNIPAISGADIEALENAV